MDGGYVDLAYTDEELAGRENAPLAESPKYPYGTSISLDEKILEKMGVDHEDWKVGDIFHLHAMAKVTSISEHENHDGEKCCVTLQIVALKGESEDAEDEEESTEAYSKHEETNPALERHGYLRYEG